jgi:enoyl-CoA hydratase/carnithine racemase
MSEHVEVLLDGPGKNALGTPVMQAALDKVRAARGKPILLSGKGDAFSAGLNLKEIAALDGPGLGRFLTLFDDLVVVLLSHDAPIVSCVNGHAIAGGCIVAMCTDLRVATSAPAARIGLNEVPLGLVFPPRVLRLVRSRVSAHAMHRVLLEGGTHPPALAKELGLVDEVAEDPMGAARAWIDKLASYPKVSYVHTKTALNADVLTVSEQERRSFEAELLPAWIKRKEELLGALATKPGAVQ